MHCKYYLVDMYQISTILNLYQSHTSPIKIWRDNLVYLFNVF